VREKRPRVRLLYCGARSKDCEQRRGVFGMTTVKAVNSRTRQHDKISAFKVSKNESGTQPETARTIVVLGIHELRSKYRRFRMSLLALLFPLRTSFIPYFPQSQRKASKQSLLSLALVRLLHRIGSTETFEYCLPFLNVIVLIHPQPLREHELILIPEAHFFDEGKVRLRFGRIAGSLRLSVRGGFARGL